MLEEIYLKKEENFNTDENFDMENGLIFVVVEQLKSFRIENRTRRLAEERRTKNN